MLINYGVVNADSDFLIFALALFESQIKRKHSGYIYKTHPSTSLQIRFSTI